MEKYRKRFNKPKKRYCEKTEEGSKKFRLVHQSGHTRWAHFRLEEKMEIYIYVYTFQFMLFFKLIHTEVRFGPVFVGYSPSGLRVSDYSNRNMHLIKIIYAGTSDLTLRQFYGYLRELRIILESKKYCLFFGNCRHVTLKILQVLGCRNGEGEILKDKFTIMKLN